MKTYKLGIVMDAIESIKTYKDSSFAMLLEAQSRGWQIYYMQLPDLYMESGISLAVAQQLTLIDQPTDYFQLQHTETIQLADLDVILMRKDPPFDLEYIYATYFLEQAEQQGTLVVNRPQSLRDCNEKLFTREFPQCCTPTRVSRKAELLNQFLQTHEDIIIKPLDGMGGKSIFRIRQGDPNTNAIIEAVTQYGKCQTMVQKFIPEILEGDKRILLIDGKPVPYSLARIPAEGENRGNLAAGASSRGQPLSERDFWICEQIAPVLREKGLIFVGIDVIGDYLTEINVTSPTCIRELDSQFSLNISYDLFESIQSRLENRN
ncbi:MAG: glutathione synthase [Gammaproteobacteria bacterium]|nr:glutathione synthase [Gammaproteobacteria bacterium]